MEKYLLIESRDPFDFVGVGDFYDLAERLAQAGNKVTLFLVQNGVLPARRGTRETRLGKLADNGVEVLADAFSLQERGIAEAQLIDGARAAPLDVVVDQLADGSKSIWH